MTRTSATEGETPATDRSSVAGEFSRLSHDVKNALNGVSVNLEVAKSRAERGVGDPSQIVPFLENAVQQLDAATQLYRQYTDLVASTIRH